jgi:hypothetical protein
MTAPNQEMVTTNVLFYLEVGEELFKFESHPQWVNKAASWFRGYKGDDCICIDKAGRICRIGKQFARARDENTFPITVYKATTN